MNAQLKLMYIKILKNWLSIILYDLLREGEINVDLQDGCAEIFIFCFRAYLHLENLGDVENNVFTEFWEHEK